MLKNKLKFNVGTKLDDSSTEIISDRDQKLIEKRHEELTKGIMNPDTETMKSKYKKEYPSAEWSCNKLAYNVDYNVPDLTGIYRHTPIECTIDKQRRDCQGKCSHYRRSLMEFFFG